MERRRREWLENVSKDLAARDWMLLQLNDRGPKPTLVKLQEISYEAVDTFDGLVAAVPGHDAPRSQVIVRPPGMFLDWLAEFFASPATYEDVFVQLIADLREEHAAALSEGRVGKARWIRGRYAIAFAEAALKKAPIIEWIAKLASGVAAKVER